MNEYIEQWLEIIEGMNNDNTYKLAWGRAIIEIAYEINIIYENNIICFDRIALKMIKYYWNQTFFFNLKQSANHKKPPVLVTCVNKLIERYKELSESNIPIWYDKAEEILKLDKDFYNNIIKQCAKTLRNDVCYRFKNVSGKTNEIYELNKEGMYICLNQKQMELLKEESYAYILSSLLNYKWAQLLEKYNSAPRIASKVKGISDNKIRRNNLTKYKNILLEYAHNKPIDFYTGDKLDNHNISVDHVIPWSYMYSDDIWNLVLTSKEHNSSKSNHIPDKIIIEKLKERNIDLLNYICEGKMKDDLNMAIENDYVDKFYLSMKI